MKTYLSLFLKGMAMGAANVIPGVSGGTIALITGIYERLIDAIKSFDITALRLLLKFRIRELLVHVDFWFLVAVFSGVGVSILSLARLLKMAMEDPQGSIWVMAFFFGLILFSVWSVGRTVDHWNVRTVLSLIVGLVIAAGIALLNPAQEDDSLVYLMICGVVAMCSMILPGLSGSFVLIIMGNYKLVMLDAVSELNMRVLIPVAIGAVAGLVVFSHFLSWVFKHFRDATISLLTGFILGSLAIIWPWKEAIPLRDDAGMVIMKKGKEVISGFEWHLPDFGTLSTWVAILFVVLGMLAVWLMERVGGAESKPESNS